MTRRSWIVVGAVVLVLVLAGVGIAVARSGGDDAARGPSGPPSPSPSVTAAPGSAAPEEPDEEPTAGTDPTGGEEEDDASASPEEPVVPEEQPATPPTAAATAAPDGAPAASLREVTVTVPNASYDPSTHAIAAAGIVDDVVETGGRCTLVATSGGARATATATARGDATATYCGTVSLSTADLAPGTWSVVVEYLSATARGASAPVPVQVG
ncbi:hypothetical protein [Frigoribacterium salinisoli]